MHGHEARHLVEITGLVAEILGQAGDGLAHGFDHFPGGQLAFEFDDAAGFFLDELFEILGVLLELATQDDLFLHALKGRVEDVVVDGLGDEVGGVVLQAADGEIHVAVAGDHDDFGFGRFGLDLLEELKPVHDRHLDVGEHDGGLYGIKEFQGLGAVFGGVDLIAQVGEEHAEETADVLLVVDEQQAFAHGRGPCRLGRRAGGGRARPETGRRPAHSGWPETLRR